MGTKIDCTHTTCLCTNYWECGSFESKGVRDRHERTAMCHPCCTPSAQCPTGAKWMGKKISTSRAKQYC